MDTSESSVSFAGSSGTESEGDAIKVFIRVRPLVTSLSDVDHNTCLEVDKDRSTITMRSKSDPKHFTFDEIADSSVTQEYVFSSIGKQTIEGCMKGYNGTIFAYGQTGSGKTFTMLGPHEDNDNFQHELRGVIPRSFEYLFKLVNKQKEIHGDKVVFLCKCSFLEIYNEQIFDLLDTSSSSLQLRENIHRGVYVEGVHEQVIQNANEAYEVLNCGWVNRTVASTTMNHESSRSHAVFTVSLESKVNQNGVWNIKTSQLHLVDLAGSERQKDTNTTGQRLKEAGSINRSLSALGNVIMALVDIAHGKNRHIPYRDSKLSFLLRDSLGGNSKTYIVACVHPGSKCFGESLSTLQFARRAKTIKNKAVINEDMQGSVIHLQAEIRRLKESLQQYQNSDVTGSQNRSSLRPDCEDQLFSPGRILNDHAKFKLFFLQAMNFYKRVGIEKKALMENLSKQQEACNRKDQALRQMKMVLKFREDALRKFEKAHKEKLRLTQDDKDDIIECLRSEVQALQAVVDHHPELVRFKMDNEVLKSEVCRLRAQTTFDLQDQKKADELEQLFLQLQSENGNVLNYQLPYQQSQSNETACATIERQKQHITKLQSDFEKTKSEMTDELQQMRRELIGKEAELVGLHKAKEELEKLFKAHQIRSQIEREIRDDLHAETLKIMTTPNKGGSKVRHSVGVFGRSLAFSPPLESAASGEHGAITCEVVPPELKEEQIDGLRDEISKLQVEYRAMKLQLEEADRNLVNMIQEKSLLETEKELTEKMNQKQNKEHQDKISELTAEVIRLTKEYSDHTERERILSSEVYDLRILNEAGDKKLTEIRTEAVECRTIRDKDIAQFETKLMKLHLELGKVKEDLELTSEERDQLREREETLQATLDFNADQLKDAEENVNLAKEEIRRLEISLASSASKIEELESDREKLLVQLQKESGAKSQQLMESIQTVNALRDDLQDHQQLLADERGKTLSLQQSIADLNAECERLLKADLKKEEVLSSMTSRVTEFKTQVQERDRMLEDLTNEVKDVKLRNESLDANCRALECQMKQKNIANEDVISKLERMVNAREVEYEVLQDDYQSAISRVDDLGIQLNNEVQRNAVLSEKQKNLESDIACLKNEAEKSHSQLNEYKSMLETALKEKEELNEKDSEIEQHIHAKQMLDLRIVELEQKLINMQDAFDIISSQLDSCQRENSQAKIEVQEQKKTMEQQKAQMIENQALHHRMELEFDLKHQELLKKHEELLCQSNALENKIIMYEQQAKSEYDKLMTETHNLKLANASLKISTEEHEEEISRLRQQAFNVEHEKEELHEETIRQKKIIDKLELDLCSQLNENAKLSGHHNHLQKIFYVDKLKDQVIKLEKENRVLTENSKTCKCKQLGAYNSSTPTRVQNTEAFEELS